jgi:hypothetical protein
MAGPLPVKGRRDTIEPLAAERRRARRPPPPTRRIPPVRPLDAVALFGGLLRTIGSVLRRRDEGR